MKAQKKILRAIIDAAVITILVCIALELRQINERLTDLTESAHDTRAMVTSMYVEGRVGMVVK